MSNTSKLRKAGILKPYTKLTPKEEKIVESLDEKEIDLVIGTEGTPKKVLDTLFPASGIGTHHAVGQPDKE